MGIEVGDKVIDKESQDELEVVEITDETCDEFVVSYDYKKNEINVSDFDSNGKYPSDDKVVRAKYTDAEQEKVYAFPISRLKKIY